VNFSSRDILTPGDAPQVLVAMNPAALKASLPRPGTRRHHHHQHRRLYQANLRKAGYEESPLEDGSLRGYQVHRSAADHDEPGSAERFESLTTKDKDRCQNFFALGIAFWMFDRPMETSTSWIESKFAKKPESSKPIELLCKRATFSAKPPEVFQQRFHIRPAELPPGTYRKVTGTRRWLMGLVTAATKMGKPLFYGTYPITPASDILHALAALRNFDVRTFQAEDEIAAMGSVIGAAFGGALAVTGTSGPGLALKSEGMNLAICWNCRW
jgi:2-oxoglutarate ferredoxin oxidoreductase subunit alpha